MYTVQLKYRKEGWDMSFTWYPINETNAPYISLIIHALAFTIAIISIHVSEHMNQRDYYKDSIRDSVDDVIAKLMVTRKGDIVEVMEALRIMSLDLQKSGELVMAEVFEEKICELREKDFESMRGKDEKAA
jgi:hypothetical protein